MLVTLITSFFVAVNLENIGYKMFFNQFKLYLVDNKLRVFDEEVVETLREVERGDLETEVVHHVLPLQTKLLGSAALLDCLL